MSRSPPTEDIILIRLLLNMIVYFAVAILGVGRWKCSTHLLHKLVWRGSSPCTTLLGKMTVQNPSRKPATHQKTN